ncbi:hypothetical protein TPHA_0L01250 [Tetrapisispora phaffii CBS 4417]|uniref:Gluconokinase n=1 Tax=Tetrapisispora phaffii (strain ATCC 24235 / CBS 4417 / NBRC 1672 / NRRL Y-8282 / UCD 70-5) TaxID=1071381 RepID=G8C004_TETPH|nr:hypothetical protein TPHA_0L01250 [Tetrapisispora phaffii CBS 4417]CCE65482.1 hypothetical protein TPHA_0L01250 [Tetrapisispora phaffii CBS 4417]
MVSQVIVLGGTAGTGKTSIAEVLVDDMKKRKEYEGVEYIEGDSLHPQANIEKMAHGHPLTDEDRWDWLKKVSLTSSESASKHKGLCIVTCSSLKKKYRDLIRETSPGTVFYFVILYGSMELIAERLVERKGHYMKVDMLQSQFDDLELPKDDEPNCHIQYLDNKDFRKINEETLEAVVSMLHKDSN